MFLVTFFRDAQLSQTFFNVLKTISTIQVNLKVSNLLGKIFSVLQTNNKFSKTVLSLNLRHVFQFIHKLFSLVITSRNIFTCYAIKHKEIVTLIIIKPLKLFHVDASVVPTFHELFLWL